MLKNVIFVLALICFSSAGVYSQTKATVSENGDLFLGLKKELVKKYKFQDVNVYIIGGKFKIDISDVHVKALPKNIRAERSKEVADFSRAYLNQTPGGIKMLTTVSSFGINHLKKPAAGLFTPHDNIYDTYTF